MSRREIIIYGVCAVLILWILTSTMEVQMHSLEYGYIYNKANLWAILTSETKEMKVTECTKINDAMEIVVEDIEGNQYAYYDTEAREIGTILNVKFQGNAIVEAEIKQGR